MESRDEHARASVDDIKGEGVVHQCEGIVPSSATLSSRGNGTEKELQMRRLQRENHLLRLQLLKLREQQHQLLHTSAATTCPASHGALAVLDVVEAAAPECAVAPPLLAPQQVLSDTTEEEEASTLRARMLQRREERQQRAMVVRSLLHNVQHLHNELSQQQQQLEAGQRNSDGTVTAVSPASPLLETALAEPMESAAAAKLNTIQDAYDEMVQRHALSTSPSPAISALALPDKPACVGTRAVDDLSAEALLQRFQLRKSQRLLRLEQLLGPEYDAAGSAAAGSRCENDNTEMTPLGAAPQSADTEQRGEWGPSSLISSAAAEDGGVKGIDGDTGSGSLPRRPGRAGESGHSTTAAAIAPCAGPTKNPNQIGRAVSDAVKNNSWYLCKVLEAALLDTIQARPTNETPVLTLSTSSEKHNPLGLHSRAASLADTSSFSSSPASATSLCSPIVSGAAASGAYVSTTLTTGAAPAILQPESIATSPTSMKVPQLLYPKGVSDTALKRAIEESLLLPFRCMQDSPRRLTPSQAAEESLPAFEAENRDAELRRCFAEGASKDLLLISGTHREDNVEGIAAGNDGEPPEGADMLGANDENLDPFARLLLARLSANLPATTAKSEKKNKQPRQYGSSRDESMQSSSMSLGASAVPSPTRSKAGVAFVAAAGSDRRVHAPKKHFSRLDEVQVEMHAPVIFNQIRDFLRMDVDRFRRAFAPTSPAQPDADGAEATSTPRRRAVQAHQRRRVGVSVGADEATAWRISVSPGKSGTTLLYFSDFVMKTVRPRELDFLLRKFLPAYVRYCERNPHTLLPRFYALATLRWWKAGVVQHFVLMQNVFATPYYIHRIYDVKGSTVNRTALQPGKPPPRTAFGALLLKDNDLPPQLIMCGTYQRAIMLAQLRSDVGFLRQLNVVDYSCMIGVRSRLFSLKEGPSKTLLLLRRQHNNTHMDHFGGRINNVGDVATQETNGRTPSEVMCVTGETASANGQSIGMWAVDPTLSTSSADAQQRGSDDDVYVCIHGCDGGLLSLPIYTPGDDSTAREEVYYLGIIDVLQTYNSAKKLESFAKGFVSDRRAISVIAPDKYAERLYNVLERITV
nr:unnamed protein product [Leishmania braziliensis]